MITSKDFKARVEEEVGTELCPVFFAQVEQRARRKLDWINERAGRNYGEDGYGDDYLVILGVEAVQEMALSAWLDARSAEIMAARKGAAS